MRVPGRLPTIIGALSAGTLLTTAVRASPTDVVLAQATLPRLSHIDQPLVATLILMLATLCIAAVAAVLVLRIRRQAVEAAGRDRDRIATLQAEVDRVHTLIQSKSQVIVAWDAATDEPEVIGDVTIVAPAAAPLRVLAFGTWLAPDKARAMEAALADLRARGEGFSMMLTTLAGHPIEAEGRALSGRAVLRLSDARGLKGDLAALADQHRRLLDDIGALQAMVDAVATPIWARDRNGRMIFANAAYASAVEAADGAAAVAGALELFDQPAREAIRAAQDNAEHFHSRLPAVVGGQRRSFDVSVIATPAGASGIAIDVTEAEAMRASLARMMDAHRRTLDQLATGVAIFGGDQRLTFYNTAYRQLWDLDAGFLDDGPSEAMVLDQLRAGRKLPEEQDFRQWKNQLHEAYRAIDPAEHTWHLPDGRTLRVVTTPNPEGGVIYLFDDVTEGLELARRYDALTRAQGETLDHLVEAVAVFGSDGRLRLFNPAFLRLWNLSEQQVADRPHIEIVTDWCRKLHPDEALWQMLRATVTAIDDREPFAGRLERRDGSVIDCATIPLPDGATLVTFQDVTDSVNVERALRERNEALETADAIKLNFLHHVSYELRSPLTNIIGFAHFLGDPAIGPLTPKQDEYLGYITVSTNALLAIINNILDLATIDAGVMTLNLSEVDIRKAMDAAAEGIQDRLVTDEIRLEIKTAADIGTFVADERRLRQILFNLIANAVGFSPPHGTVTLEAARDNDAVLFTVTDRGPGIPPEVRDKVFDWFETHSLGSRHRGTGLGLSLVRSFVELHGGTVRIDSEPGNGTSVTCCFPLDLASQRTAAE